MRNAVLIAGSMRGYIYCMPNQIKHVINLNNADVFVVTCNINSGQNIKKQKALLNRLILSRF